MKNTIIRLTAIIALAATCASGAAAFASAKTAVQTNEAAITECAVNKEYTQKETAIKQAAEVEEESEVKTVTVTYDAGLVKAELPKPITVVPGKPYRDLKAPGHVTGYTFDGWYLDGTEVTNTTIVTANTNHVLTAAWKSDVTGKVIIAG